MALPPKGCGVDPNPIRVPGQGSGEPSLDASALYVHCSTILEGRSGCYGTVPKSSMAAGGGLHNVGRRADVCLSVVVVRVV